MSGAGITDRAAGRALMRQELELQPSLLPKVAARLDTAAAPLRARLGGIVWVGGCGDSLFAGEALAPHFRQAGHGCRPATAAEMLWEGAVAEGDTVIAISISGSTRRTVEAVDAARSRGARTIAVTINADSALARAADATLVLPYTPVSRAIPHGLDYHVTVLALAALAGPLGDFEMGGLLAGTPDPQVADLSPEARFFFLGGGAAARGTAAFAAAKLHEAGGLPAVSFEAENFCHGAQFMLRPGDHVGLYGCGGPADARTLAMADGLRRIGCHVAEAGFVPPETPFAPLRAALLGALHAQAFTLAVAERLDLDVTDPGQDGPAAAVQKEWFGWQA